MCQPVLEIPQTDDWYCRRVSASKANFAPEKWSIQHLLA